MPRPISRVARTIVARPWVMSALATLLYCCLTSAAAIAQSGAPNLQHTKNTPDLGLRSGLKVDPSTLAMSIEIPLGGYPGRAGTGLSLGLHYNSKVWRVQFDDYVNGNLSGCSNSGVIEVGTDCYTTTRARYAENSVSGWTFVGTLPTLEYDDGRYDANGHACCDGDPNRGFYIPQMTVRFADGSTHELRRGDAPLAGADPQTGTYLSVDSSRMKFVGTSPGAGTLYMPDGSRYDFADYAATRYVDRNGNVLAGQTDTLGRQLIAPAFNNGSPHTEPFSIPGVGGTAMSYAFDLRELDSVGVLEPDMITGAVPALRRLGDSDKFGNGVYSPSLFTSVPGSRVIEPFTFNPVVLHRIVLPDGRAYTFTYNEYGEIAKVVYPTGGYERYRYGRLPPLAPVGEPYSQANRGVVERRVSATGAGGDEAVWLYESGGASVTTTAPDGRRTVRLLHTGYSFGSVVFGLNDPRAGMAYEESVYAPQAEGGAMLRRTLTEWGVSGPEPGGHASAKRDPKVLRTVEILLDTGAGADPLAATTTYEYDGDLNLTATHRHGYVSVDDWAAKNAGVGSFTQTGAPLRTDETTFLVNDPTVDASTRAAYRARNLLGLPTSTRVKDGAGNVIAKTAVTYDQFDAAHYPLLTYPSVSSWADPQTGVRGLATTANVWLNTTDTWLSTHVQYDQCGSPRKTWDANNNQSEVAYSAAYQYAYPTQTTSAAPDPTGGYGSAAGLTASTVYDFSTGLITSATDANGQTTSYSYADDAGSVDPFDRLMKVERPDGGWTKYNYGSNEWGDYVHTRVLIDSSGRETDSYDYTDGLGRPYRSFRYENQDTSKPWLTVDTEYDALGRVARASAPYRSTGSDQAMFSGGRWVETSYDALSRVTTVTTRPDGAAVTTSYAGQYVTVRDQAGKVRRSMTDALGRLVRLDEPDAQGSNLDDAQGNPVQPTSYGYDALGNLRAVTQGAQTRTFAYDSLSRLTSATNPESGTVSYTYDANGNLKTKTDARGVVATYTYDALNRNTLIAYSDGTPGVKRTYDKSLSNGLGRLRADYTWDGNNTYYTHSKVDNYDAAGRPLDRHQFFCPGGAWGPDFATTLTYDLAGAVTSVSYPSGHAVSYNYDAAGRLGDVVKANATLPAMSGNLGGEQRAYASEVRYDESGGMSQERFGADTPVYNKHFYNGRGQLAEIRVSTYAITAPAKEKDWNRGLILNVYSAAPAGGATESGADNNGNLRKQMISVPYDDQISGSWDSSLIYDYDALNRLKQVREVRAGANQWVQRFDYDRWGNRTINASATTNAPSTQFDAGESAAANRLYAPGDTALPMGQRQMRYDAAGNLTYDVYTGAGGRAYDAENRMVSAQAGGSRSAVYTYDAGGLRVKRSDGFAEVWQVYGLGGELLAEYAKDASPSQPQKEYGYRGGELLVTAEAGGGWGTLPSFTGEGLKGKWVQSLYVVELRQAIDSLRAHKGLPAYQWVNAVGHGDPITAASFAELRTALDEALGAPAGGYTQGLAAGRPIMAVFIEELRGRVLDAWQGGTAGVDIRWLVADHLGTPRMVVDRTGSLAGVTRHDYFPFGEEIGAGTGGRTTNQGYGVADGVRQSYTGYEKDGETGLNFAQARYYSPMMGRFTSPDPLVTSGKPYHPQSWNRYAYCLNNPLTFIDPTGLIWGTKEGEKNYKWFDSEDKMKEAGYNAATKFLYEIDGTYYAVNPNANEWKSFNTTWAAERTYWKYTGLEASWQDWVPVWGTFRRMMFNIATENYEGAMGSFATASVEGGTLNAGGSAAVGKSFATKSGEAVFFSGRRAATAATEAVEAGGGKTMAMTTGGKILTTVTKPFPSKLRDLSLGWGSKKFAQGASGEVRVFLRPPFRSPSTWEQVEEPILRVNPFVKIIER